MNEQKNFNSPFLITCQPLKEEFMNLNKVVVTSEEFTLGRGKQNSTVIPFLSISRNHCKFKKLKSLEWIIEDYSTFGIEVNGIKIGKGSNRNLSDGDIVKFEPTGEFVYKFVIPSDGDEYEIPRKRIKIENETENNDIINNVKVKFEMSQNYERSHIEKKIESAKQMVNTTILLKQQLQSEMDKKILQLETNYALQIENLKGEKNEVEQQTAILIKERDAQLTLVQEEMGGKIVELMERIKNHNENEKQLLQENNLLKEKLEKEREVFLGELLKESSSKQDMLEQLEKKMKEQEEIMKKEKEELENMHKKENEQLRLAKEKELREMEEQKKQRETELKEQLEFIKKNLEKQVEETEEQRIKAEQELNERLKEMQQLSNIEKVKVEQLEQEREELKRKFCEAQTTAEKSLEELKEHVRNREIELAALAADRIQQQAVQSSEVIQNLQQQLETVQHRLQIVEAEKCIILENSCVTDPVEGTSSKQSTLTEFGELMESELQCSICAELFVEAITLNCSHTFCKYCISRWKSKKKDCPICRSPIITECRSLVLDSFIDKMVQNLSEEMKTKREEMLNSRKAQVEAMNTPTVNSTPARRRRRGRGRTYMRTPTYRSRAEIHPSISTIDLTWVPMQTTPLTSVTVETMQIPTVQVRAEGASRDSRAPTTAATAGASDVVPEDTGHLDAHLDNLPRNNEHLHSSLSDCEPSWVAHGRRPRLKAVRHR